MRNVLSIVCSYVQTSGDIEKVAALKSSLESVGPLSSSIQSAFAQCDQRLVQNEQWMRTVGEQIIVWIRTQ
jgi:hypothetical protein